MGFGNEQKAELAKPLDPAHVKPPAPGKHGDYIEGWRVIDEANRIFGFDGWTRETVHIAETCRELLTLKDRNGAGYQQWRVGYIAKVRVTAGGIVREGTGCGSGAAKPENLADAIEGAAKEAETDAMKRALMTFGNPFGLALYDKTKANVQAPPNAGLEIAIDAIGKCETQLALKQWWAQHGAVFDGADAEKVVAAINKRKAAIETMDRSAA